MRYGWYPKRHRYRAIRQRSQTREADDGCWSRPGSTQIRFWQLTASNANARHAAVHVQCARAKGASSLAHFNSPLSHYKHSSAPASAARHRTLSLAVPRCPVCYYSDSALYCVVHCPFAWLTAHLHRSFPPAPHRPLHNPCLNTHPLRVVAASSTQPTPPPISTANFPERERAATEAKLQLLL